MLTRRFGVLIAAVAVLVPGTAFAAVHYLGSGHGNAGHQARADVLARRGVTASPHLSVASSAAPTPQSSRKAARRATHGRRSAPAPRQTSAPPPAPDSKNCRHPQYVSSDPNGGWSNGGYYVAQDMWNIGGYSVSQTLDACAYNNWYVAATMNNANGDGAVKTYPNVHEDFSEPAIGSFRAISSTFAEQSPHVGIYEDAYDIWINGVATSGSTEVMVWTENHGQTPSGSQMGSARLGGRSYQVWKSGSYIAFVANSNFTSGTVNLLQIFNWIMAKGWIPASSTLGQIDYGAELVSTNGAPATFSFTNFSISTS
jgi:hypothetical protein